MILLRFLIEEELRECRLITVVCSKIIIFGRRNKMKGGCWNKILWVDLSKNKIWEERLPEDITENYLGGYGLGVKILFDRQKAKLSPFDPENILGFTTGPLIGTPAITGCRFTVVGKSPLTGTWGDSNSGGFFGPAFKKAGFDGIFITGAAKEPVYLFLEDGKAAIRSAASLWGEDTHQTERYLKEEIGEKVQVASIGEPGERKNLLAAIMHDGHRAAARGGLAALMGSKNLKALAVIGNLHVPVVDEQKTKEIRKSIIDGFKHNPSIAHFTKYGTMNRMAKVVPENDPPVKNYAGVGIIDFPNPEKISDDAILAYQSKKYACWQCPIACSAYMTVADGPYQIVNGPKPEYETLGMLGSDLLNDNIESIIYANYLCNRHGLDTISVGGVIAYAMECFEKGYLTTQDTGGLDLSWGNHDAIVKLIEMMAKGEGFGNVLVNGSKIAAEKIGKETEQFAMHIQGQEIPAHDPRFAPSWGLLYKVDATPGRHTQTGTACYELGLGIPGLDLGIDASPWNKKPGKYELKGRGFYCARVQNIWHAVTQAGCCTFCMMRTNIYVWSQFINAICGTNFTLDDLETIGARIATVRQAFNIREGLSVGDFELPKRIWAEALPGGPLENITIDVPAMVLEYYDAQGWDQKGYPKRERLIELGLDDLAEMIEREK